MRFFSVGAKANEIFTDLQNKKKMTAYGIVLQTSI